VILGHIEKRRALLKTLSPVFIWSGANINKKEYVYFPNRRKVIIPDLFKLYGFLEKRRILQEYVKYLDNPDSGDLLAFLRRQGVQDTEIKNFALYEVDAGDAVVDHKSRKGIYLFIKGADGMPYIPGSSLKGAIRTALLAYFLNGLPEAVRENCTKEVWNGFRNVGRRNIENITKSLDKCAEKLEGDIFNKLELYKERPRDAVNDLMRGLSVSDSGPLPKDCMVLCKKTDMSVKGRMKAINLFRECIKPGLDIEFELAMDLSIAKKAGLSFELIGKALEYFSKTYEECFSSAFPSNEQFANINMPGGRILYLGGGAGFVSKTAAYPLMGRKEGLRYVSSLLNDFSNASHSHGKDMEIGASPHMIKCAVYQGKYWHMGKCGFKILV